MAAINAPQGERILLADARPLPREVICGGIISDDSMGQLSALNMPEEIFSEPKIIGWRLFDWQLGRHGGIRGDRYHNVERNLFDKWLLEVAAARKGIEVWERSRFVSARSMRTGGVAAGFMRDGVVHEVTAASLIGADGAISAVRRMLAKDSQPMQWMTLQQELVSRGRQVDRFLAFLDDEIDYYGWVIPKNDRILVGAGFSNRNDMRTRFQAFCDRLAEREQIFGDAVIPLRGRPATRLRHPSQVCLGSGDVMLAGEAAALICPWSGEGIAYALRSGAAAGAALAAASPASSYRKYMRRTILSVLIDLAGRAVMKRPWARRGAAAIHRRSYLVPPGTPWRD